jgi:hypothetical protein
MTKTSRKPDFLEASKSKPGSATLTDGQLKRAETEASRARPKGPGAREPARVAPSSPPAQPNQPAEFRAGSKQALVLSMLQRKVGTSLADLVSATGWLPHTTRAALTGLRKRGYVLERSRPEESKPSVYRVVEHPAQSTAA